MNAVFLVSKDGIKKRAVRTVQDATLDTGGDYLLLRIPFDNLEDNVNNLLAHRKNSASGQEMATTLAIASCDELSTEFGSLMLVGDGGSIIFSDHNGARLEVDGLIVNTSVVLLNSVKHSPKVEDVESLLTDKTLLEYIIAHPSGFTTIPEGVLKAMEGITQVVPILSGYDFKPAVLDACQARDVRSIRPNGTDYSFRV